MEDNSLEATITHIQSFSKFLQIFARLNAHKKQIDFIYHQISHFIKKGSLKKPLYNEVLIGEMYIVEIDNEYFRCVAKATYNNDLVLLYLCDVGALLRNSYKRLFKITPGNLLTTIAPQIQAFLLEGVQANFNQPFLYDIYNDLTKNPVKIRKVYNANEFIQCVRVITIEGDYSSYLERSTMPVELISSTDTVEMLKNVSYSEWVYPSVQNDNYSEIPMMCLEKSRKKGDHLEQSRKKEDHLEESRNKDDLVEKLGIPGLKSIQGIFIPTDFRNCKELTSMPYKSYQLTPGQYYDVTVVYVINGAKHFVVHMNSMLPHLQKLSSKMNKEKLFNFERQPLPGTLCIAPYAEDNLLYRVLVLENKLNFSTVMYIDYGNVDIVETTKLYKIPKEFMSHNAFAIHCCLSNSYTMGNYDDEEVDIAMKNIALCNKYRLKMNYLVNNYAYFHNCELFYRNVSLMSMLKKHLPQISYNEIDKLENNDKVIISYIESPKKFYVRKTSKIDEFEKMMDEIFICCKKKENKLKVYEKGVACAVNIENAYYRAEIVSVVELDQQLTIRLVDFGYEKNVKFNEVQCIDVKFLSSPIYAIECCLIGFENNSSLANKTVTTQFEMLADGENPSTRRQFKIQIHKKEYNLYVVQLLDDSIHPVLDVTEKLFKLNKPPKVFFAETDFTDGGGDRKLHYTATEITRRLVAPKLPRPLHRDHGPNESLPSVSNHNLQYQSNYQSTQKPLSQTQKECFSPYNNYEMKTSESKNHSACESAQNTMTQNTETFEQDYCLPGSNELVIPEKLSLPRIDDVSLSVWKNMYHFFVRIRENNAEYLNMQIEIQLNYKTEKPFIETNPDGKLHMKQNTYWIVFNSDDQFYYRGRIIGFDNVTKKPKCLLIDNGLVITVNYNDLYLFKKCIKAHPIYAYQCSIIEMTNQAEYNAFNGCMTKTYVPEFEMKCHFKSSSENMSGYLYFVELYHENLSLKDYFIKKGLFLEGNTNEIYRLLCGQRIKVKIDSIDNLLKFQIVIDGCEEKWICSYNDIKFIECNFDLSKEFKKKYEKRYCVIDIIDVTSKKHLMVHLLIPLFCIAFPKKTICEYPIIKRSFEVQITHLESTNILYVVHKDALKSLNDLTSDMNNFYEIEKKGQSLQDKEIGNVCAVKSTHNNWCRARIIPPSQIDETKITNNKSITLFYIDSGITEQINDYDESNLKELDERFCTKSAFAIRIFHPIKPINRDNYNKTKICKSIEALINIQMFIYIHERYKSVLIADFYYYQKYVDSRQLLSDYLIRCECIQGIDITYAKNCIDELHEQSVFDTYNKPEYNPNVEDIIVTENNDKLYDSEEIIVSDTNNSDQHNVDGKCNKEQIIEEKEYFDDNQKPIDNITTTSNDDEMISAQISHFDTPGIFYLQLSENMDKFSKLQDDIQIVASSLPSVVKPVAGTQCIALHSVEGIWYRAVIIDSELLVVKFIDIGAVDALTDTVCIKQMIDAFENIDKFAIPCALPIAPNNARDWSDDVLKVFTNVQYKGIKFKFISKNESKNYIQLWIGGVNIAEKLIADGLAKRLEVIESGEKCFVSHISTASDFYIQLEREADRLDLLDRYLCESNTFPKCDFVKGKICSALYPDDGCWYRAELIEKFEDNKYKVFYIDYGNTSLTDDIREISEEIVNLSRFSKKCSLFMPKSVLGWSEKAEERFRELARMGQTIFTVDLIEPNKCAIINLSTNDGINVCEELVKLCDEKPNNVPPYDFDSSVDKESVGDITVIYKNTNITDDSFGSVSFESKDIPTSKALIDFSEAMICFIESINKFYIQKKENQIIIEIQNKLNKTKLIPFNGEPELNQIYIALYGKFNDVYRAKLMSYIDNKYTINFIDYGNTEIVDTIYLLDDEKLKMIPPQAYACKLHNANNINFDDKIVDDLFKDILKPHIDGEPLIIVVNGRIPETSTSIVQLYNHKFDIYENLISKLKRKSYDFNKDSNKTDYYTNAVERYETNNNNDNKNNEINTNIIKTYKGVGKKIFDNWKSILFKPNVTHLKEGGLVLCYFVPTLSNHKNNVDIADGHDEDDIGELYSESNLRIEIPELILNDTLYILYSNKIITEKQYSDAKENKTLEGRVRLLFSKFTYGSNPIIPIISKERIKSDDDLQKFFKQNDTKKCLKNIIDDLLSLLEMTFK